jgi:hypothetical protein
MKRDLTGVYLWKNLVNKKRYVGQKRTPEQRERISQGRLMLFKKRRETELKS